MKKKALPVIFTIVLIVLIGAVFAGQKIIEKYSYSDERADLDSYFGVTDDTDVPIILQTEPIDEHAKLIDGAYYLDIDSVHKYLNERFYEGKEDGTLIYTTPTQIITAVTGTGDYSDSDGGSGTENYQIARYEGDTFYVALDYVKKYTNFSYDAYSEPNHIQMCTSWDDRNVATIEKDTKLRDKGGVKSSILEDLSKGDSVTVIEKMNDWSKVMTKDAFIGYVENKRLSDTTVVSPIAVTDYVEPEYTSLTKDTKINMGWHAVASKVGNDTLSSVLSSSNGINVISPTWYHISSNNGDIVSYASSDYVRTVHDKGIEVWALIDNFSDNSIDSYEVLSHASSRQNLISQLMGDVLSNGIDGINVDFESISTDCGQSFIEFVRELSVSCRANGIVLSIDNYVPLSINDHYDRKEQGIVADYVVIMGYDEHYSGSSEAGSVASISYVKNGIENTVDEVDSKKVINGIPFYTRIWTTAGADVSSEAVSMEQANSYVSNHGITMNWDEETCQNYGEYTDSNGNLVQIWMEDAESVGAKLGVMSTYDLGGVAEWKLGFETSDVWDEIAKYTAS